MPQQHQNQNPQPTDSPINSPTCDFCGEAAALLHCRADAARLCLACDRLVHAANTVSTRHQRWLLCDACGAAASSIHCSSCRTVLCSNCDFDAHSVAGLQHDRRPVEGFSGCPSAAELVGLIGIGGDEKAVVGDEDVVSEYLVDDVGVWETVPVFSLGDLLVPTTAAHGFQAMGMPPLPKHRNSSCGKKKDELIRQIRELVKDENIEICDGVLTDQATNLHHEVATQTTQQGDLEPYMYNETRSMATPVYKDTVPDKNHIDLNKVKSTSSLADHLEEYPENLASTNATFHNDTVEVPLSAGGTTVRDTNDLGAFKETIPPLPPKFGHEERTTVISRYREKRKTRRYDKLIRYESRKIRADGRVRIKGRFAKAEIVSKQ